MNASDVRAYVKSVLTKSFTNKSTIDKLSTSDDGNLLFDGNEIKGGAGTILSKDIYYTPENYSEEEKVIGVWKNGKPIYKRIFNIAYNSTIEIQDLDEVIYCWWKQNYGNSGDECFMYNVDGGGNTSSVQRIHNTNSLKLYDSSSFNNDSCFVIVEYTKTTDLENSFNESMIVDEIQLSSTAVDMYNTEEKVCGRWHNGKPVYRKVVKKGIASKNVWTVMDSTVINAETVISGKALQYVNNHLVDVSCSFYFAVNEGGTGLCAYSTAVTMTDDSIFIFEYTKTSDEPNSFNSNMLENVTVNYAGDNISLDSSITELKFGIDENGDYGYYKVGADTVTPFKNSSNKEYIFINNLKDIIPTMISSTETSDTNKYYLGEVSAGTVYNGNYSAHYAFDKNSSSMWVGRDGIVGGHENCWIQYEFPKKVPILAIIFGSSHTDSRYWTYKADILARNNNDETWNKIGEMNRSSNGEEPVYIENVKPYKIYRIKITQSGAYSASFTEIKFMSYDSSNSKSIIPCENIYNFSNEKYIINGSTLSSIKLAISEKLGISDDITVSEFAEKINAI